LISLTLLQGGRAEAYSLVPSSGYLLKKPFPCCIKKKKKGRKKKEKKKKPSEQSSSSQAGLPLEHQSVSTWHLLRLQLDVSNYILPTPTNSADQKRKG